MYLNYLSRSIFNRQACSTYNCKQIGTIIQCTNSFFKISFKPLMQKTPDDSKKQTEQETDKKEKETQAEASSSATATAEAQTAIKPMYVNPPPNRNIEFLPTNEDEKDTNVNNKTNYQMNGANDFRRKWMARVGAEIQGRTMGNQNHNNNFGKQDWEADNNQSDQQWNQVENDNNSEEHPCSEKRVQNWDHGRTKQNWRGEGQGNQSPTQQAWNQGYQNATHNQTNWYQGQGSDVQQNWNQGNNRAGRRNWQLNNNDVRQQNWPQSNNNMGQRNWDLNNNDAGEENWNQRNNAGQQFWNQTNEFNANVVDSGTGVNSWMSQMRNKNKRKQNDWVTEMKKNQAKLQNISKPTVEIPKLPFSKLNHIVTPTMGQNVSKSACNQCQNKLQQTHEEEPCKTAMPTDTEMQSKAQPIDLVKDEYLKAIKVLYSLNPKNEFTKDLRIQNIAKSVQEMISFVESTGLKISDLERIPMIQVTGTKGRGSTCAIVEAILRSYGLHTGLYSSPHIFLTTERIRIDGYPLDKKQFTELFWFLYNQLNTTSNTKMLPSFNKFLTVMAFHTFVKEQVDVAVIEVGPACAMDCTNVISNPCTIGITTLGMEHASNLTNSMRDIAWNKAAIMKQNASVFTNATQPECIEVLAQRAKELKINFYKVPMLHDYIDNDLNNNKILSNAEYYVRLNGSLGIQLAYDWLRNYKPEFVLGIEPNATRLTQPVAHAISSLNLPGYFQKIRHNIFNVYLDCADTMESMMACRDWFYKETRSSRTPKVLLFNKVNEFNSKDMLYILRTKLQFEYAYFVPNPALLEGEPVSDGQSKAMIWHGMEELQRAKQNASNWRALCEETGRKDNSQLDMSIPSFFESLQNKYGLRKYGMNQQVDILVTGSHQLVCATINVLKKLHAAGN